MNDLERKPFQLQCKVDRAERHLGRNVQDGRSEVKNTADSCLYQNISNFLSGTSRYAYEAEADVLVFYFRLQFINGSDDQAVLLLPYLIRVVIKDDDDSEILFFKTFVVKECSSKVAEADQGDVPGPVNPQNFSQTGNEISDVVADTRMAELPEIGQILTNLCIGQAQGRPQSTGGNSFLP